MNLVGRALCDVALPNLSEETSPVGDVGRADRGHYNASQTLNLCLSGKRFHIGNADISYCVSNISPAVRQISLRSYTCRQAIHSVAVDGIPLIEEMSRSDKGVMAKP